MGLGWVGFGLGWGWVGGVGLRVLMGSSAQVEEKERGGVTSLLDPP